MIAELIERLTKLDGPDREVDAEIARLEGWTPTGNGIPETGAPSYWYGDAFGMPAYTASLDAAIALVERLLPGWEHMVGSTHPDFLSDNEPRFTADLAGPVTWAKDPEYGTQEPHYETSSVRAATPAIALLLALLRALEGQE